MKKIKKFLTISFITTCIFSNMFISNVFAKSEFNVATSSVQNEMINPRAEKTGYKYKYVNGVKYKRLWSYTYEKWIDKEWTIA
ncbi:MAG: hypothetical protein HFE57_13105 [Firmicutes bacterium]|jgi:hypothetical protein|nr:hypothetical protein [Bacillota bacterium]